MIRNEPPLLATEHATHPPLLTAAEVASLLRIGRNRVYELAHHNHIPAIRIGKRYRFPRALLLAWINGEDVRHEVLRG